MSGPGIRYFNFALELAADFSVTLLTREGVDVDVPGARLAKAPGDRELAAALSAYDVVVTQQLPPPVMRALAKTSTRVVYDLYVPALSEARAFLTMSDHDPVQAAFADLTALRQRLALATGDAFICASERQRDLWLGELMSLGRIDLATYRRDRTLREVIDIVPFGLPAEPAQAGPPVLKGVHPGIAATDQVLLWAGGIWNWLDPATVIRAVVGLGERRDDVRLVFLGTTHPTVPAMAREREARALARSLGALNRLVFFRDSWAPYGERGRYLLEADLGVCAHIDSLETRFSFRTRLVDHFWAGLPTITTEGDVLAELVVRHGLGRAVAAGDVAAWVAAIEELLDSADARSRMEFEAVRAELSWPQVVRPLTRLALGTTAPPLGAVRALTLEDRRIRARASLALGGLRGAAGRQARKLTRAAVRG
jgi:glycosyltransferase involved in cell wall biosynthesis